MIQWLHTVLFHEPNTLTIERGPMMGTPVGAATSGDNLALDASTGQIYDAPPQHCGTTYRCLSGQAWAYLSMPRLTCLFYALVK